MNIKPLGDRVVTKTPVEQTQTQSGIILTSQERDNISEVEVVAVGPNVTQVAVGDTVIVMESLSQDLVEGTDKYWAFHEDQILAVKE